VYYDYYDAADERTERGGVPSFVRSLFGNLVPSVSPSVQSVTEKVALSHLVFLTDQEGTISLGGENEGKGSVMECLGIYPGDLGK